MSIPAITPRRGGRTRSPEAHHAVLIAAAALLDERGYPAITIEGIAERSGVAKSTIYRWWRSKSELVLEAYTTQVNQQVPEPNTGSLDKDLTVFLAQLYRVVEYPLRVQTLRGLMADAQLDPVFREPFRNWVNSRRQLVARMLERGLIRGEITHHLDINYTIDLVLGPFWHRLLIEHTPLDPSEAANHATHLLNGLRADSHA